MGDRLPDQLAGVGVGLEESDDVACDLARVLAFDPLPQAGEQLRPALSGVGPVDRHLHGTVIGDRDVMGLDAFLALHADTIGDPELPVVPRAGEQVAVELALGEAVALVGTGVVDRVHAVAGAHEAHAVAIDLDHPHGADGEVVEVDVEFGLQIRAQGCVHAPEP